jgi:hypothetical protein
MVERYCTIEDLLEININIVASEFGCYNVDIDLQYGFSIAEGYSYQISTYLGKYAADLSRSLHVDLKVFPICS